MKRKRNIVCHNRDCEYRMLTWDIGYFKYNIINNNNNDKCGICLYKFNNNNNELNIINNNDIKLENDDSYLLYCGHRYHVTCLNEWEYISSTHKQTCKQCPQCKRQYSNQLYWTKQLYDYNFKYHFHPHIKL